MLILIYSECQKWAVKNLIAPVANNTSFQKGRCRMYIVEAKVKIYLEQATKAQSGSRYIALLFL